MADEKKKTPKRVAIVAMGESHKTYTGIVVAHGCRSRVADETWAINGTASVIFHDRLFLMDDLQARLKPLAVKDPNCMTAGLLSWIAQHPGPVYVPTVYPEIPGAVEYPLAEVIEAVGTPYLNSTVAYALAYAITIGVENVQLYGCDFTYPDKHAAESGRACVEFLMGIAGARGIVVTVAGDSTLLDACVPHDQKYYGYAQPLSVAKDPETGKVTVTRIEPEDAESISGQRAIHRLKQRPGTAVIEHHCIPDDGQVMQPEPAIAR